MSENTVLVQTREETGKNANRRTRAAGLVPAVVYGGDADSFAVQVEERTMLRLLRDGGSNTILLLQLEGTEQSRHVMVREIQTNPLNGRLRHLDFQRIDMSVKVAVDVPVELEGTPVGVKTSGGIVEFINREISIRCLPGDIPQSIVVNIEALEIGQHVEVHEVELAEGLDLEDEPNKVLVSVAAPAAEEVEESEEDGEAADAPEAAEEPEAADE